MAGAVLYLLAAYAITLPSGLIEGQAGPSSDLLAALKLVAEIGVPASLQILDARSAEWRSVRVKKDPACAVCGATRASSAAGR